MPYLETIRMTGTLSGHGRTVPIEFDAGIDDDGVLTVTLDRMPFSRDALELNRNRRPGERADMLTLQGLSTDGWRLSSDNFVVSRFGHGSEVGRELEIQGHCSDAEFRHTTTKRAARSRRVWFVRQLRAVHGMTWSGPLGDVVAGGPHDLPATSQQPSGAIQLTHPTGDADTEWWAESEAFMTHVARVLSFGCDSYLLPVMEQRAEGDQLIWRVVRRSRASPPFLAPFHVVHMEPIFRRACDSYATHRDEVSTLDPAIRWLTAPIALWEQRLTNAVTALESVIERTSPDGARLFLTGSAFKRLSKEIKATLRTADAPAAMELKLPDLNRRPVREQLNALIEDRNIEVADFPATWFDEVVRARNAIVHTGVAPTIEATSTVTFEQVIWAREIVTRLILDRIGFIGPFQSWLHGDQSLHFPECELMAAWVARQPKAAPETS